MILRPHDPKEALILSNYSIFKLLRLSNLFLLKVNHIERFVEVWVVARVTVGSVSQNHTMTMSAIGCVPVCVFEIKNTKYAVG